MTIDLLLLHAPSVYDFRERAILYGPVSDLIPSSPVFEMYPLGFLTMVDYLEARGMEVRVVNLALRMMSDPRFDVEDFLARIEARAVGIDLHWLPHAHGAIEVAKIVKRVHPGVPVIFGGLSATYFHEELIRYPEVDYVLRGDSTEPPLHDLLLHLQAGRPPCDVPNLTWKEGGGVRVNPFTFVPDSLDYADISPQRMVRMALRYRDLRSVLPFDGWWQNPITAVFTVKGCTHACVTCGNARDACALLSRRHKLIRRSPASLVRNMKAISQVSRGPIFLVGDLRQAGDDYAREVLALLRAADFKNEIVFELFAMPPAGYLEEIDRSVRNWSLELSPESHDEEIRRNQDETVFYTNAEMEAVIRHALALRCHRVDVFFMIGLPRQTRASVMDSIAYCESLFRKSDSRLSCFISPMGPFLDPASRGFEEPERYGYRLFARTLEEHRQLLVRPSWSLILNYETECMSREVLGEVTYEAAQALNALKLAYGRLGHPQSRKAAARIAGARELQRRLHAAEDAAVPDPDAVASLKGKVHEFSVSTVCDKTELDWQPKLVNFNVAGIARTIVDGRRAGRREIGD
jgi:B12-binding domain/radical SAM domain protein